MSTPDPIIDQLPRFAARGTITVDDEQIDVDTYETDTGTTVVQTRYELRKAPFERLKRVSAVVDGSRRELTVGSEVTAADQQPDGRYNEIDLSVTPDAGTDLSVSYVAESILSRYTGAFDERTDELFDRIKQSIDNKQVANATGQELDFNGDWFGELGDRRGRTDAEYRTLIQNIVPAFSGRGTVSGVKFAVASAADVDTSDVVIDESSTETGFSVSITANTVTTQDLTRLIRFAKPAGSELLGVPTIVVTQFDMDIDTSDTTVDSRRDGLGAETLGSGTLG